MKNKYSYGFELTICPLKSVSVKGVGAQGSWPSTTKLVAWVDNGVGFIPWTPYVEGDEIKMKGDEIKREQGD